MHSMAIKQMVEIYDREWLSDGNKLSKMLEKGNLKKIQLVSER